MGDNVVQFPEDRSPFANIDAHLETIDNYPDAEKGSVVKLALQGFGKLMDAQESEDRPGSLLALSMDYCSRISPSARCWVPNAT